jgi:selenide,water dikinase
MTVDFFAPLVDDPYQFGSIAAANALSDVYAMGGEVTLALNVAAFPEEMAPEIIADILRGGADKVAEAGGVIAGGHTIIDDEPKYGLCVMGLIHPERILTKGGARPGDILFLTKPLGTGVVMTAAMSDDAEPENLQAAIDSMTQLNRHASHIAREVEAHALTDVTGFGLLGHGYEIADASGVALRFDASLVPLLPGAREYAARDMVTGGASRNRKYLADKTSIEDGVPEEIRHILFDPQTSGGLLFGVAADRAADVEDRFAKAELSVWQVGEVVEGSGVRVAP